MVAAVVKFYARLPRETHEKLTDWAKQANRSVNGQLVQIIQDAIREKETREQRQDKQPP